MKKHSFRQSLGLLDATMIVVGSMIGSGIFIVSADITRSVGSAGWLILIWIFTGILTIRRPQPQRRPRKGPLEPMHLGLGSLSQR